MRSLFYRRVDKFWRVHERRGAGGGATETVITNADISREVTFNSRNNERRLLLKNKLVTRRVRLIARRSAKKQSFAPRVWLIQKTEAACFIKPR